MEIIQLKKKKQMASEPTTLDLLEILKYRSITFSNENNKLLDRLRKGEEGELEVLRFIKDYGRSHWKVIRNYWGDYNGRFESDLILFTDTDCYVFEIKNYVGSFEYKEGISSIDGTELTSDCVFQTRRSYKNIRNLIQNDIPRSNVHGVLVFIGEHNNVQMDSNISDINVVKRTGLMRFLQKIALEEQTRPTTKIPFQKISLKLELHAVSNPFIMEPLTPKQIKSLKNGIACAACCGFNVQFTRKFIKCPCGNVENRRVAMVRTICEYGVLTYNRPLRCQELYSFLNGDTSYSFLQNIMYSYFGKDMHAKKGYYINKKINI